MFMEKSENIAFITPFRAYLLEVNNESPDQPAYLPGLFSSFIRDIWMLLQDLIRVLFLFLDLIRIIMVLFWDLRTVLVLL